MLLGLFQCWFSEVFSRLAGQIASAAGNVLSEAYSGQGLARSYQERA